MTVFIIVVQLQYELHLSVGIFVFLIDVLNLSSGIHYRNEGMIYVRAIGIRVRTRTMLLFVNLVLQ